MENVESRFERTPWIFSSAIGFFSIGLALIALILKPHAFPPILPFLAMGGGLVAWKIKSKGAHGSALAMLGICCLFLNDLPFSEGVWIVGWTALLWISYILVALGVEFFEEWQLSQTVQRQVESEKLNQFEKLFQNKEFELASMQNQRIALQQQVESLQHSSLLEIETLKRQHDADLNHLTHLQKQHEIFQKNSHLEIEVLKKQHGEDLNRLSLLQKQQENLHRSSLSELEATKELHKTDLNRFQALQKQFENVQQKALIDLETKALNHEVDLKRLEKTQSELNSYVATSQKHLEELFAWQKRCEDLEQKLSQTEILLRKKQALAVSFKAEDVKKQPPASPFEAMYKQLKQQFEWKNDTLEAARKELFYTQEKLAALTLENQETSFNEDVNQQRLIRDLQKLENSETQSQQEIDSLNKLVSFLLQRKL